MYNHLLPFPRLWTLSIEWFWFSFRSILNGVTLKTSNSIPFMRKKKHSFSLEVRLPAPWTTRLKNTLHLYLNDVHLKHRMNKPRYFFQKNYHKSLISTVHSVKCSCTNRHQICSKTVQETSIWICAIPGIFELGLDRFPKFITKGLIF